MYSIIHGIEIYPVDSTVQPLNNQGQKYDASTSCVL